MWTFSVKSDKVEEFEELCKKYGYEPENYYGDGWYDIYTGSEKEPLDFYNECKEKDLLWFDKKC